MIQNPKSITRILRSSALQASLSKCDTLKVNIYISKTPSDTELHVTGPRHFIFFFTALLSWNLMTDSYATELWYGCRAWQWALQMTKKFTYFNKCGRNRYIWVTLRGGVNADLQLVQENVFVGGVSKFSLTWIIEKRVQRNEKQKRKHAYMNKYNNEVENNYDY